MRRRYEPLQSSVENSLGLPYSHSEDMAHYRTTIRCSLSSAEAFARMADVARFAEWDPGVLKGKQVVGAEPAVGAKYDLLIDATPKQTFQYEITEFEPGSRYLMVARTRFLTSIDEITVDASGADTRVTYDATLLARGALGLFDGPLQRIFNKLGDRAAKGLALFLGGSIHV
jgi:hypothetical protein